MRLHLNRTQSVLLILFWVVLCYMVVVGARRVDGPLVLSLVISGALVFIPIYKSMKMKK